MPTELVRYTVRLADGRLFHFKEEATADHFAKECKGTRVPFSVDMLSPEVRAILGLTEEAEK
jgi:hypothetical protein